MILDLIHEVLVRSTAKCIKRCSMTSRQVHSITRGKHFSRLFLEQQLKKPPLVLHFHYEYRTHEWIFRFWDTRSGPVTSYTVSAVGAYYFNHSYERGLICIGLDDINVMVINPSLHMLKLLPALGILLPYRVSRENFLGYEPKAGVYKVLSLMKAHNDDVPHCHLLDLGEATSWKRIECPIPHRRETFSSPICINGVIYYRCLTDVRTPCVITFDLASEIFRATVDMPEDLKSHWNSYRLASYQSRLCFVRRYSVSNHRHSLWLHSGANAWSKLEFSSEPFAVGIEHPVRVRFEGSTPFSMVEMRKNKMRNEGGDLQIWIVYYNPGLDTFDRFFLQGLPSFCEQRLVWNYTESLLKI